MAAPETTVALVQTRERETEIIGQPAKIINLGTEQIYVYTNTKVTLAKGKVTDA